MTARRELTELPGRVEVRATGPAPERRQDDDGALGITGYASLFNQPTLIEGWFDDWEEEVAAGAFTKTLEESERIVSTFNHDAGRLLGATDAGTARFSEDDTGLLYDVDINAEDPFAVSVYRQIERGDVRGASIWFRVMRQEWVRGEEDQPDRRIILEAQLFEAGPVVFPAFTATTAGTRSVQVLDSILRVAGVPEKDRAELVVESLTDPERFERELRSLLAKQPELRARVCECKHDGGKSGRDGTPVKSHLPGISHYERLARGWTAQGL